MVKIITIGDKKLITANMLRAFTPVKVGNNSETIVESNEYKSKLIMKAVKVQIKE